MAKRNKIIGITFRICFFPQLMDDKSNSSCFKEFEHVKRLTT